MSKPVLKHSVCSGHKFCNTLYLLFMSLTPVMDTHTHTHTHTTLLLQSAVRFHTGLVRCSSYIPITAATYTNNALQYTTIHLQYTCSTWSRSPLCDKQRNTNLPALCEHKTVTPLEHTQLCLASRPHAPS